MKPKIIISHDIDHLGKEKWWIRIKDTFRYYKKYKKLINPFRKRFWSSLQEMLEYDLQNGVKSTWFVSVANANIVNYSLEQAKETIDLIKGYGFDVGCHAINFWDEKEIRLEKRRFQTLSELDKFGVRIHRLRTDQKTLRSLDDAGYLYDSSLMGHNLEQPFKVGDMTEFPIHFMDSRLMGFRHKSDIEGTKNEMIRILKDVEGKKYINILFHDRRFHEYFLEQRVWYIWLINYLKENGYTFINYRSALQERN